MGRPSTPILAVAVNGRMSSSCPSRESNGVGTRTEMPTASAATALQWGQAGARIVKGCDGFVTDVKGVRRYRLSIACAARQWMYHKRDGGHGGTRARGTRLKLEPHADNSQQTESKCICRSRYRFGWFWAGWEAPSHHHHHHARTGLGCCGSGQILTNAPLNSY